MTPTKIRKHGGKTMTERNEIWDAKTGITNLTDDDHIYPHTVAVIEPKWDGDKITSWWEYRNIIAAIETGQIEGVYDIPAKTVQGMSEHGMNKITYDRDVFDIIKDQKEVMDRVFRLAEDKEPLTLGLIKELHAQLTYNQDYCDGADKFGRKTRVSLLKGQWKKQPNNPSRGSILLQYCPPVQVQSEMERLLEMHEQHMTDGTSCETAAAWLHHRFTQIHPFQDGNGRMARVLASYVLLRGNRYPFVVLRQNKRRYLHALGYADDYDLKSLIEFIDHAQVDYVSANKPITQWYPR